MEPINTYTSYKFSIWLFDKDSKNQKIWTEDAKNLVKKLTIKYFGFGTVSSGEWIYTHENWEIVTEPTILVNLSLQNVKSITIREYVENLKKLLNQESIMVNITKDAVNFW